MWCCLVTIVQVRYSMVLLSNHCAGKILCGVVVA